MFHWKPISKEPNPRKVTDDATLIQGWMQRVEKAADSAIKQAMKSDSPPAEMHQTLPDESVYQEARQLLNQWMYEKRRDHAGLSQFDQSLDLQLPPQSVVRKEWDHLLERLGNNAPSATEPILSLTARGRSQSQECLTSRSNSQREAEAFMQKLRNKQYVSKTQLHRVDNGEPRVDIKLKMDMRQEAAKARRQQREAQEEARRVQRMASKEATVAAKQMLLHEERDKLKRQKHEEELIQKEMIKIRQQMELQRRMARDVDDKVMQVTTYETLTQAVEEEVRSASTPKPRCDKPVAMETNNSAAEESFLAERQKQQLLQKCFAAWFRLVLNRRVSLGRVGAMADWRMLRSHFHAWRRFAGNQRLLYDQQRMQEAIKAEAKNNAKATAFHHNTMLRKCLLAWVVFSRIEVAERESQRQKDEKLRRMQFFLNAIENTSKEEVDTSVPLPPHPPLVPSSSVSPTGTTTTTVIISSPVQERMRPHSGKANQQPSRTQKMDTNAISQQTAVPSIPRLENIDSDRDPVSRPVSGSHSTISSSAALSTPSGPGGNNFEHRHRAQQAIVKEQQKQLREQKRLIEELQAQQRRKDLEDELRAQKMMQELLEKVNQTSPKSRAKQGSNLSSGRSVGVVSEPEQNQGDNETMSGRTAEETQRSKATPKSAMVKRMEEREVERQRLKQEREARKRQQEEEKLARLERDLAEKQQQEDERKALEFEKLKEKRKLEKMKQQKRLREQKWTETQNKKADEFRAGVLLRHFGWLPWKRLLTLRQTQATTASDHHWKVQLRNHFLSWKQHLIEKHTAQQQLVDQFRHGILLRQHFSRWKMLKSVEAEAELTAIQWYETRLQVVCLRQWAQFSTDERIRQWKLEEAANKHCELSCLKKHFHLWRKLPEEVKKEKAKLERLKNLRRKVAEIIPDYDTDKDSLQSTS